MTFPTTEIDELQAEAMRRLEALVERITDQLMGDPADPSAETDRETCRQAAIAVLAQVSRQGGAHDVAGAGDSLLVQLLRRSAAR